MGVLLLNICQAAECNSCPSSPSSRSSPELCCEGCVPAETTCGNWKSMTFKTNTSGEIGQHLSRDTLEKISYTNYSCATNIGQWGPIYYCFHLKRCSCAYWPKGGNTAQHSTPKQKGSLDLKQTLDRVQDFFIIITKGKAQTKQSAIIMLTHSH